MTKTPFVLAVLFCSCAFSALAEEASPAKINEQERVFKLYDTNGDGNVSFDEYKTGQGDQMSPVRMEKVFKEKDRNGDGKLSLKEFFYTPSDQKPAATPGKPDKKSK